MRKLNFGCGSIQPKDWVNVDKDEEFSTWKHTKGFDQNIFDIIVAHAVVQQFEWHEMVDQLKELHRILKPGGVIRISLPNILRGFDFYNQQDRRFFPNGEEDLDDKFSAWLTWYSTSKTLLTPKALAHKLMEAGFHDWRIVDFQQSGFLDALSEILELDTRQGEFYFVEAIKK